MSTKQSSSNGAINAARERSGRGVKSNPYSSTKELENGTQCLLHFIIIK